MSTLTVKEAALYFYGTSARGLTLQARDLMVTCELADAGSFPTLGGPYQAGDNVNISGQLAGEQTLRHGPVYFNGKRYATLHFEGSLVVTAAPFVVPPLSSSPVDIRTAFGLSGTLKAYASSNISGNGGPAVFEYGLNGKGYATAHFSSPHPAGNQQVTEILSLFYYCTPCHGARLSNWLRCLLARD